MLRKSRAVVFDDDCMAALPTPILREFGQRWKQEVGIPFFVAGRVCHSSGLSGRCCYLEDTTTPILMKKYEVKDRIF